MDKDTRKAEEARKDGAAGPDKQGKKEEGSPKKEQPKQAKAEEQVSALQSQVAMLQAQLAVDRQGRENLEKEVKSLQDQNQDWQDKCASLQRYAVEMTKSLDRVKAQTNEEVARTKEKMLKDLLPTLDDFERALQNAHDDRSKNYDKMVEGVQMVSDKLFQHLAVTYGLERMKADGEPFDPQKHEAVQLVKDPKYKEKTVVASCVTGYTVGGKVLRPAKVMVGQPA